MSKCLSHLPLFSTLVQSCSSSLYSLHRDSQRQLHGKYLEISSAFKVNLLEHQLWLLLSCRSNWRIELDSIPASIPNAWGGQYYVHAFWIKAKLGTGEWIESFCSRFTVCFRHRQKDLRTDFPYNGLVQLRINLPSLVEFLEFLCSFLCHRKKKSGSHSARPLTSPTAVTWSPPAGNWNLKGRSNRRKVKLQSWKMRMRIWIRRWWWVGVFPQPAQTPVFQPLIQCPTQSTFCPPKLCHQFQPEILRLLRINSQRKLLTILYYKLQFYSNFRQKWHRILVR